MNWFNIVNFILALAPQEVALVKAIVDAAHVAHQTGRPLQPVVNPFTQPLPTGTVTGFIPPDLNVSQITNQQTQVTPIVTFSDQKETPSAVVEPPANGVKKTL